MAPFIAKVRSQPFPSRGENQTVGWGSQTIPAVHNLHTGGSTPPPVISQFALSGWLRERHPRARHRLPFQGTTADGPGPCVCSSASGG